MNNELPGLDEYVEEEELMPAIENAFPTRDSLKWFVRNNKEALITEYAMIIVAGRFMYHPKRFQYTTVEIGQKAALKFRDKGGALDSTNHALDDDDQNRRHVVPTPSAGRSR